MMASAHRPRSLETRARAGSSKRPSLRTRLVAPLGSLLCSLGVALLASTAALALEAGDAAPDFSAPSLDGQGNVSLAQYRGKVVYLDFWASWCAPCLKAIPEIEAMRKELAGEDFQVVAVNLDQQPKKALRFLEKHPIGYPSASDPKGRLPKQFGVDTMPTSYLIDGKGVIRLVHRGFQREDGVKLRAEIRKLLGGR
ncbi:MAG: TlpA disulfide reductase family protein [Myxococcota bacterium]